MKKIFILSIALFISTFLFSQGLLKINDSLLEYIKNNLVKFQLSDKRFLDWEEGVFSLFTYSKELDEGHPIILFSKGKYPVGVLQGISPNAYFLFDSNGDGILDIKSSDAILPYWVVFDNSKNKTKNNNLYEIFDLLYDACQSDLGPYNDERTKKAIEMINSYSKDINLENRDLIYLLHYYIKYSQELYKTSLDALALLTKELNNRFSDVHPLLFLYTAETLINMGHKDKAKTIIDDLREMDPDFIPAKVYEYILEKNKRKADILLKELKEKYGNHWIVKQL